MGPALVEAGGRQGAAADLALLGGDAGPGLGNLNRNPPGSANGSKVAAGVDQGLVEAPSFQGIDHSVDNPALADGADADSSVGMAQEGGGRALFQANLGSAARSRYGGEANVESAA